jgi:hypothetical protein
MAKNEYEKFIVRDAVVDMSAMGTMGGSMNSPFVSGGPELIKVIEGARPNFALYYVKRAGMFMEPPHYHPNDEYLMFISSDPHDMKNLGAVVQIAYGEEWEKVEFSTSALVYFPKNLQHCPIHVKKMDRPFLFGHFWPMGEESNFMPGK